MTLFDLRFEILRKEIVYKYENWLFLPLDKKVTVKKKVGVKKIQKGQNFGPVTKNVP